MIQTVKLAKRSIGNTPHSHGFSIADGVVPPLNFTGTTGNPDHFLNFGLGTIPGGAAGKAWTGENVFNSGNLKLDLLHNFFLESGARMGKIQVYEDRRVNT